MSTKTAAAAKTSKKKSKIAEGFALPTPSRAPVSDEAARRFEQKGEPAPPPPPAHEKKGPVATARITLRVHPDTFKAIEEYAYEQRLTQKRVICEGLKKLGIKVAPSDLE